MIVKIRMKNPTPLSEADIKAFEAEARLELPLEYREFVRAYNGAKPDPNRFEVPDENSSGINQFIPVNEILNVKQYVDNVECRFLPIARCSCGDLLCIDLDANGEVFYWDHELPSSSLRLARDINSFLEALAPFDVKEIADIPRHVQSVWINPEFLKRQRDQGNTTE